MTREQIRLIPELNKKILHDEAHLVYLKEKATAVPALATNERVKSSKTNDSMKYADAAIDLEAELMQKRAELKALKDEATIWIETLESPLERRIFVMRLIKCFTWDEIADLIGYSRRRIFQLKEAVIKTKTL